MTPRLALALTVALVLSGCHRRVPTSLERKEAANIVSEAEFAVTLKDWPRAEGLYAKAAELCPDDGDTWVNLGVVLMHEHKNGPARDAYKSSLSAYAEASKLAPTDAIPVIRRAYVLVVLGRADDARSLVNEAQARIPNDRRLRAFIESKGIDKLVADPDIKDITP
jgi:Flp pilus assembly protein TadD